MTDIVERLRGLRFVHVPVASGLMEEAANEIERLRLCVPPIAGTVPSDGGIGFISVESLGCVAESQVAYYTEKARISLPDGFEPRALSAPYGFARQGWISVEERLPEEEDRELTSVLGWNGVSVREVVFAPRERPCSQWSSAAGGHEFITHWMPLPEPPEVT
jgi:hypothetical protein